MKLLKIKEQWLLLIILIYSGCNFQTDSVQIPTEENKQPFNNEASLREKAIEDKLESDLYSILPEYHKESNWADSVAIIYTVFEAYKTSKPNPGHFIVKSGKSWACFTFDYPLSISTDFVELKSDNQYYYIGRKEINDNTPQQPKALSQSVEDEEGVTEAQFLPSTNEQEFELFDTTPIPDRYVGELSKQFREYKEVYRIPKSGGWAQTIVGYLKDNPSGAVPTDGPYDEKWKDKFKVEIIQKL